VIPVITGVSPVWRLYAPDWLTVFTSVKPGEDGSSECLAYFRERFEGRVGDGDWQIVLPDRDAWLTFLRVRLPCLKGEFADEARAYEQAGRFPGRPCLVVRRGSPEERELQAYGRRRVQDAGGDSGLAAH
jgi:hypothetical protein